VLHKNFIFIFSFILVLTLTLVSAAPPPQVFDTSGTRGYILQYPQFEVIKQNNPFTLKVHVFNASDGLLITSANCTLNIRNQTGNTVLENNLSLEGDHYNYLMTGGNFSVTGTYAYVIYCIDPGSQGGFASGIFKITPTGTNAGFGLYLILIFSALVLVVGAYTLEIDWGIFLSGVLFVLSGMYAMIYGLGDITDLYTRGIAIVSIGLGLIFVIAGIYNLSKGGNTEEE